MKALILICFIGLAYANPIFNAPSDSFKQFENQTEREIHQIEHQFRRLTLRANHAIKNKNATEKTEILDVISKDLDRLETVEKNIQEEKTKNHESLHEKWFLARATNQVKHVRDFLNRLKKKIEDSNTQFDEVAFDDKEDFRKFEVKIESEIHKIEKSFRSLNLKVNHVAKTKNATEKTNILNLIADDLTKVDSIEKELQKEKAKNHTGLVERWFLAGAALQVKLIRSYLNNLKTKLDKVKTSDSGVFFDEKSDFRKWEVETEKQVLKIEHDLRRLNLRASDMIRKKDLSKKTEVLDLLAKNLTKLEELEKEVQAEKDKNHTAFAERWFLKKVTSQITHAKEFLNKIKNNLDKATSSSSSGFVNIVDGQVYLDDQVIFFDEEIDQEIQDDDTLDEEIDVDEE